MNQDDPAANPAPVDPQSAERQPSDSDPHVEGEHYGRDYTSHLIGHFLDDDGNPRRCEREGCDNIITTTRDSWSVTYCMTHKD